VRLGSLTSVSIRVPGEEQALIMDVPNHVAWRNGLEPGIEIGVSLLAKAIHVMPRQESGARSQEPGKKESDSSPQFPIPESS
jgi:hypothetical protein